MSNDTAHTYANPLVGIGYDLLSRLVFAPVGGLAHLRREALDVIGIHASMPVLELGCGTGGLTRALLERGARVVSVDRSEPMLAKARRRAPAARFERCEITAYQPTERYECVLFAFVLHELDANARQRALALAKGALAEGGCVGIVDHALPSDGVVPKAVSAFVHSFEPESTVEWLRGGFVAEIEAAGLRVRQQRSLARGTAVVLVAN